MPQDFWGRVIYLLQTRGSSYAMGALNTMIIALVSTFIGCVIGFAVGIVQTIPVSKRILSGKGNFRNYQIYLRRVCRSFPLEHL